MRLCKYKDAFGKPGEGIHRLRIFGLGLIDVVTTLLGAYLISYFSGVSLVYVIPAVLVLGVIVHRIFCVRTKVDRMLFPNG